VTSDVITLPDDRRLSWHEFGDPDGVPVLYTPETPVSGLGGAWYDQAARASGLRWISLDKPGYGGSDYQRRRSLISWAGDLAALAGHLGLDRFALAGESGGGPFTLAATHLLADRVSVVALIASAGGLRSRAERTGQQARIRFCGWLARNVPALNAVPFTMLTPVHLWHGALDTNVPIASARDLPNATLHVSDSSDHDIGHQRSDEITIVLASCAK
jgi:pimeloyl-ACP methyl ester carboxylesterase